MGLLMIILALGQFQEDWPRIAVTQPYEDFLGWRSDTAWVHELIIHDLAGETEETTFIVTTGGTEPAAAQAPGGLEPGIRAASMASILEGTSLFFLEVAASEEDLRIMDDACMDFEEHLDVRPPLVPVMMELANREDGSVIWSDTRSLTWFGGECAPIFDLPVLETVVLSPDCTLVFFGILYGPYMEYFVVPAGT